MSDQVLGESLKQYWGYDSFRPLQELIVQAILAGRDVVAVMPTGGGKSLCYQLPAVISGKTTVVISPLIALMQDQVVQLGQMGISAAAVNSAMPYPRQIETMRAASRGEFRVLYISPERLAREDTVGWLDNVQVGLFAIDEAHCISEWGHEFRPDYRQLGRLRELFPTVPIAAFTASATHIVRHDILAQLKLAQPVKCIRSFYRPNLRFFVRECTPEKQDQLLVRVLHEYAGENVIVYAPTISTVEETVEMIEERGIRALPYHGQMKSEERRRNQEAWMQGEVNVIVGTLAFGLGINKASVRAVIHLALPKSLEQYYQEAGRAGRDGLAADCVLLWRKKDTALLAYFINEIDDPAEQKRAWRRYHDITGFASKSVCRHRLFCTHFGETPKWDGCGHCDACGWQPDWIVSKKPKRIPSDGTLTVPARAGAPGDIELRARLLQWRRDMAKRLKVPAFVIFNDVTVEDLCRQQPRTIAELRRVQGFGQRKTEMYGGELLELIRG